MSMMDDTGRQLLGIVLGGACIFSASCATAQITQDRTLPNNSNVTINGSVFNITGGTQAGRNLFHSFQQFSVPTGSTAFFNNGLDIQNIFGRVTGGIVSKIDGLIRANGRANLFLINPSGIIFGPNASLGLNGSFFASTANSLVFDNGFEFSATNPQALPLLTVNIPIGLRFRDNPGSILVQGDGQGIRTTSNLMDTTTGLQVQPNQTLALVGGDINLEGATLKTAGGRIELGSVAGNGLVSLTPINKGFSLGYGEVQNFGKIQLSQQAAVDASGEGGGDIQVWGRNVTLTDGSQIEASTLGSKPGGSLVVNAQDSVQLIGTSSDGQFLSSLVADVYEGATGAGRSLIINTHQLSVQNGAQVESDAFGTGKGGSLTVTADSIQLTGATSGLFTETVSGSKGGDAGDLTINTHQLSVQGGAVVSAGTFGTGKGGSLTVTADSIQLTGAFSGLFAQTERGSTGNAGNLTINTHQLSVQNRAQVSASTYGGGKGEDLTINDTGQLLVQGGAQVSAGTFGTGKGGSLIVTADSIQLTGTSTDGTPSGLFAQTERGSTGDAGDLTINTHQLSVQGGAQVSAGTSGVGRGGSLTVTADSIQLTGAPSGLSTETVSGSKGGDAGDLTINTHQLSLQGGAVVSADTFGTGRGGSLTVTADSIQLTGAPSGLFAQADRGSTGNAGNLTINTQDLTVQNGAIVSVGSSQGQAGDLTITAKKIRLDQGSLNAVTAITSSNPSAANIKLQGLDLLFLRNNSRISAQAISNTANGGNITIDAPNGFVVAAPSGSNGSDIVASAFRGRGGNIQITSQSIYGLTPGRSIVGNGTNDIDASSQFNQAGTVNLNTSYLNPSQGLVELPKKVIDPTRQIAQNSCQHSAGSSFTITGRGGLPPSPDEPLTSDVVWTDTRLLATTSQHQHKTHAAKPKLQPIAIMPATGWVFNDKGQVVLTAYDPTNTGSQRSWREPASCGQH